MTALCKPYATTAEADQAVADLLAAGVPGSDVRLLMGAEIHDARREARGRFAGSVPPDERVRAFRGQGPQRKALLMEAGLDDATAEADVHAIHEGRVVVLVDIGALGADELRAVLDGAVAA